MEEDVNKNKAAIEICQKDIEQLRVTAEGGPSAKATQMTVEDLVKEATLQIRNSKQLFISKCEKEEKVKETLNNILERDAKIERIIDLSKKKSKDGKKSDGAFIVQLNSEQEQDEVMRKKS